MTLISVVLPLPEGPRSSTDCPWGTLSETWSRAGISWYPEVRPTTCRPEVSSGDVAGAGESRVPATGAP